MYNEFLNEFFNNVNYKGVFPVDVLAHEDSYEVYADLPGFSKEEISVTFDNGYLTILAKHNNVENLEHKYLLKERSNKGKKRSIYFGDILEDHISAKLTDGVLKVTIYLRKPEEKKARSISIE